jgi:hypothetical protein
MNICGLCGRPYIEGGECGRADLGPGGTFYRRGVNLQDRNYHNCGVNPGAHHQQYCDVEDRPRCCLHLIGCQRFNSAEPDISTGEQ